MNQNRKQKWIMEKANWETFQEYLNFTNINKNNINDQEYYITNTIIHAAKSSIPLTTSHPLKRIVPWWNNQIKLALKEKKRLLRAIKISFNLANYGKFLQSRQICRKLIREAKKKSWNDFVQSINSRTPSSKVYEKIRRISGKYKKHQITSLIINSQIITNTNQICEAMADSFSSTSSSNHYSPNFLNFKNQTERTSISIYQKIM